MRSVDRRYLTLVHGRIAPDTGLIDAPLARDPRERMRMARLGRARAPSSRSRRSGCWSASRPGASTTASRCWSASSTRAARTRFACTWPTSSHPCVGDQVYGQRRLKADLGLERQFLHAYRLELEHPVTGERAALRRPAARGPRLAARADRRVLGGSDRGRRRGAPHCSPGSAQADAHSALERALSPTRACATLGSTFKPGPVRPARDADSYRSRAVDHGAHAPR